MAKLKNKIALINHGCAKNLVDSELMLGMLSQEGFSITLNDDEADIVIINTCSFIHDAEQESVQSIIEMVNKGKKIIQKMLLLYTILVLCGRSVRICRR